MNWLEVSLSVDTSVADAVAEVFSVYSYGGVALEQEDIPPEAWDDGYALPPVKQTVRGYLPLDEHTESV